MADHLSEEEQIEALKRWWKESGLQAVLTLAVIFGGYFGWQGWQNHQQKQAEDASVIYLEMLEAVSGNPGQPVPESARESVSSKADQLKTDHAGTQYARYAAMLKARLAVESDDLDTAAQELQWAIDDGADQALVAILRLRLARVEAARGNPDKALQLVQGVDAGEMKSAYEEAKGDFLLQQGNSDAAYTAYQSALSITDPQGVAASMLQLKLSQLRPAQAPKEASEEESEGNES